MQALDFKTGMTFAYGEASELMPGVLRLVANNPGPFTFKGTNTYLVGAASLCVIDPGPADGAHIDAILKAANGRAITHILSTHAHRDHVDAIPALKARTGAKVYAFARAAAHAIPLEYTPQGRDFIDLDLTPDIALAHGASVQGEDWALDVLHTPGHAPDHACFALQGSAALFSGDHVMAWNTSIVAPPEGRMADYIASLELLLERDDGVYLPGHGGRLMEPQRTIKAFLLHRRWREQAILKAIIDGAATAAEIVPKVYPGIAARLIPAATLTVLAHVELLAAKGLVEAADLLSASSPLRGA